MSSSPSISAPNPALSATCSRSAAKFMCATVRARGRAMQTPAYSRIRSTVFLYFKTKNYFLLCYFFCDIFFFLFFFFFLLFKSCTFVFSFTFLFSTFCPFAQAAIWATHLSITPATFSLRSPFHVRWTSVPTDRTRATSPHGSPHPCCQHVVPVTSPALDHATSFFNLRLRRKRSHLAVAACELLNVKGCPGLSLADGAGMMTGMATSFASRLPCGNLLQLLHMRVGRVTFGRRKPPRPTSPSPSSDSVLLFGPSPFA